MAAAIGQVPCPIRSCNRVSWPCSSLKDLRPARQEDCLTWRCMLRMQMYAACDNHHPTFRQPAVVLGLRPEEHAVARTSYIHGKHGKCHDGQPCKRSRLTAADRLQTGFASLLAVLEESQRSSARPLCSRVDAVFSSHLPSQTPSDIFPTCCSSSSKPRVKCCHSRSRHPASRRPGCRRVPVKPDTPSLETRTTRHVGP